MHGLINRAIEGFVRDTYGEAAWQAALDRAGLAPPGFEAMLLYEDAVTWTLLAEVERGLGRPLAGILEDIGTHLVSSPRQQGVRRLLRFGGATFEEFLQSLDDLPGRARLAVAALDLPALALREGAAGRFTLTCRAERPGWGHVLVGLLRALADDYGTLAMVEHRGACDGGEVVAIELLERAFTAGRAFDLASADAGAAEPGGAGP